MTIRPTRAAYLERRMTDSMVASSVAKGRSATLIHRQLATAYALAAIEEGAAMGDERTPDGD